jgi:hypothetical protein
MLAIALVVVAVVAVLAGVLLGRRGRMKVRGNVDAEGTSVGNFSFAVERCLSGQTQTPRFFGVDLRAEGGFGLSVLGNGDGARLRLFSQGGRRGSLVITKQQCPQWDVSVERYLSTLDRAAGMTGHLNVTCQAGGGALKANVVFERCPD